MKSFSLGRSAAPTQAFSPTHLATPYPRVRCALLIIGAISAISCAKDRDPEEYQEQECQKKLARLEGAAGNYTGLVTSKHDGSTLGALQIKLHVVDNCGGSSPIGVAANSGGNMSATSVGVGDAALAANIDFEGPVRLPTGAPNGSFDEGSGQYQAEIPIQRQDKPSSKIKIRGAIDESGAFTGLIWAADTSDYEQYGGEFRLQKNGRKLSELAQEKGGSLGDQLFEQKNFGGTTTFATRNEKKPVNLVLLKPKAPESEDFLNLFLPVKPVVATLTYGGGADFVFQNATWNQHTGILNGDAVIPDMGRLSMTCSYLAQSMGFKCRVFTNISSQVAAMIDLSPTSVSTDTGSPDDSNREPIFRAYNGTGSVPDPLGDTSSFWNIVLKVTYDARTRTEEILSLYFPQPEKRLRVSVFYPHLEISVTFERAKWDTSSKTVNGTIPILLGGIQGMLFLSCKGFDFVDPNSDYNFTCRYMSSVTNVDHTYTFKK